MKKIILSFALFLSIAPNVAFATPTSWDYSVVNSLLQPLQSQWAIPIRVHGIVASSTTYENILPRLNFTNATGTAATTTDFFSTKANFNTLCIALDCKTAWPGGLASYDAWTHPSAGVSASSSDFIIGSGVASSTILGDLNVTGNATNTNATSTNSFFTSLLASVSLRVTSLTSALTLTGADGVFAEYTGTTCTNQFIRSLSALGVATCESVTTSDITDGTITGDDVNSNIAGRNLTLTSGSPDTLDVDSEIYTFSVAANLFATTTDDGISTTTEDFLSVKIPIASTVTAIDCYADTTGTSTIKASYASSPLSAGTQIVTAGTTCGSQVLTNTTSFNNSAVSAGNWLRVWVSDAEPTGSRPTRIYFTITLTKND